MELIQLQAQCSADFSTVKKRVVDFLAENNLENMEKGLHYIEGEDFFVNVIEYETVDEEQRIWEAHKRYLDVHVLSSGMECIQHSFVDSMKIGEYHEDDDYLEITGNKTNIIHLSPGELLVFYPEDAHKTGIKSTQSRVVRKGVFKVRIQ